MGGTSTTTSTPKFTGEQRRFLSTQVELAQFQLEELQNQREAQGQLFEGAETAAAEFDETTGGFTGEATPEQQRLIEEATRRALETGESDISRFQSQATEQLREELAPQLGLRTGDTPILDRGSRIAGEATRQQGQLVSNLRGQQATSLLNFPILAQQFQADLKRNAFINRLQLGGSRATAGLGLAGASTPNIGGFPTGSTTTSSRGIGLGDIGAAAGGLGALIAASARDLKDTQGPVDETEILQALQTLPVERWTYKGENADHIGTFAEDFREAFGVGDGVTINMIDAVGVLMAAVKELSRRG